MKKKTKTDEHAKVSKAKFKRKAQQRLSLREHSLQISSKESMLQYNATTYTPNTAATWVNNNTCIICFDAISHNDKHFLHCGHQFHCKCIKQWLAQSHDCPICKSPAKGRCVDDDDNNSTHSSFNYIIDTYEFVHPFNSGSPPEHNDMFNTLMVLTIVSFLMKLVFNVFAFLGRTLLSMIT